MKRNLLLILMLFSIQALFAQNTVYNVIETSPEHNVLKNAIDLAGLDGTLQGDGPFTVFAPTDAAFNALDPAILEDIISDPGGALREVLLYHILDNYTLSSDLSDGQVIETLHGQEITVTFGGNGEIFINDAEISIANIETDNGVLHIINAVLLPSFSNAGTIAEIISGSEDHGILETVLIATGLYDSLDEADGSPFTLFAPSDEAFDALPEGLLDILLADPSGLLTDILLFHITGEENVSGDLSNGQFLYPLGGGAITVTIDAGNIFINNALITVTDLEASNGVIHVINTILIPVPCFQFAVAQPYGDFNNIFGGAPSPDEEGECEIFTITDFEVWAGELYIIDGFEEGVEYTFSICEGPGAGSWEADLSVFTLSGQLVDFVFNSCSITWVSPSSGSFLIGINESGACAIESAHLETNNGHPSLTCQGSAVTDFTVFDIIQESPDHTLLTTALIAAGLDEVLGGAGPFTVFAPADEAFEALPDGLLEELLENPALLSSLLLYHIASGNLLEADLTDGREIVTLSNGEIITISFENGGIFVNDAQITVTDITADNGVVHVISSVLDPETVSVSRRHITHDLEFFPNPAREELFIRSSDDETGSLYEILDLNGRVLRTGNITYGQAIPLNSLSAGYYLLTVRSEKNVRVGKFAKM